VGRLRIPTNSPGSTYFIYQTDPDLNKKHHLRLVSNDYIELREGATIGGLEAESRVSIFTLDPGSFCSTFDNTDMPGMKYHTYDHLDNLRVTYRRVGASLPVDATYEYSPYGRVVQTFRANTHKDRYLSTGHEREASTNYDYRLARLYDAELGRFLGVDMMAGKYPNLSTYSYVAGNPLSFIDPDGRIIVPVHGTWSDRGTWKDLNGIQQASSSLFNDNRIGSLFPWSGGNYAQSRSEAALQLIDHLKLEMNKESFNGQITLVGHSHGGNISIEALNMMVGMKEFDNVKLNLLSINTPVRDDYQLSDKAKGRVNHVNVFDPKDPVQTKGGNDVIVLPNQPSSRKGTGEFGVAGREFKNARNIKVDNPQGLLKVSPMPLGAPSRIGSGDFHNSHNRVDDWLDKTRKQ
jgi:RHS repeat-associated protein